MPSGFCRPLLSSGRVNGCQRRRSRPQPGRELGVVGQGGRVDQLLDAGDGHLVERRDPAGERVGEAFDLGVGDQPLHVPYPAARLAGMSSPPSRISSARPQPTRRPRRAMGPPPEMAPTLTSNWPRIAFSDDGVRAQQVDRAVIECHPPVGPGDLADVELFRSTHGPDSFRFGGRVFMWRSVAGRRRCRRSRR